MPYYLIKSQPLFKSAWSYIWGKRHVDDSSSLKTKNLPRKPKLMRDKVALVTGGASGIGRQIVEEFLEAGAMGVAIADINQISGRELAYNLDKEFGRGRALFVQCDIRKSQNFDRAYKQTLRCYKQLDVVVNNAGMLNDPKWETTISTNIGGCVIGSLLGMQYMSKCSVGNGGHVINIASTCGLVCSSGLPIYSMTQSAIIGLGRALGDSDQYDRSGVKVITLCVGPTETNMLRKAADAAMNTKFKCELLEDMQCMVTQKPKDVSSAVMTLLTKATPGSVWIARCGEPPFEAVLPDDVDDVRESSH